MPNIDDVEIKLAQASAVLLSLTTPDHLEELGKEAVLNNLHLLDDLVRDARKSLEDTGPKVYLEGGEQVEDLQRELAATLRETVEGIENVVFNGRSLLDAIDKSSAPSNLQTA